MNFFSKCIKMLEINMLLVYKIMQMVQIMIWKLKKCSKFTKCLYWNVTNVRNVGNLQKVANLQNVAQYDKET